MDGQSTFTESDVAAVASRIKSLYVSIVRARGHGWDRYSPGPRHEWAWSKAASLCLAHGLDPDDHVRALLSQTASPLPFMLTGDRSVQRTRAFSAREGVDDAALFSAHLARLEACLLSGESLESTLNNPFNGFSPSFVACVATRAGLQLSSALRRVAERELSLHPRRRAIVNRMLERTGRESSTAAIAGDPPCT